MKKIYVLIAAVLAIPSVMSAQSLELEEAPDFEVGCRSVYWGTEASTHPNNPCKGATSRKCAEIDNQIISIGNGLSTVITTVRDRDGVVKSVTRNVVAATADAIIQEEMVNLPANAEMTHVRQ